MHQIILVVCIIFASLPLAFSGLEVDLIEAQSKDCKEDKERQGNFVRNIFTQSHMVFRVINL